MQQQDTATLPLRTVSRLTGLSPDILRAWEKRYQVVAPLRGARGARLYTGDDVAHLQLLARVVSDGRSIGDVAHLDRESLENLAGVGRQEDPAVASAAVERALAALEHFDGPRLNEVLSDSLLGLGAIDFAKRLACPLLVQVGERWSRGEISIAEEHLLSSSLRGLLGGLFRSRASGDGPTVLLATPSGEGHEFGILIVGLLAADAGLNVVNLGPDLPADEIADAADRCQAEIVGLGLANSCNQDRARQEIEQVARKLPLSTELWLGGCGATELQNKLGHSTIRAFDNLDAVRAELLRVRAVRNAQ